MVAKETAEQMHQERPSRSKGFNAAVRKEHTLPTHRQLTAELFASQQPPAQQTHDMRVQVAV